MNKVEIKSKSRIKRFTLDSLRSFSDLKSELKRIYSTNDKQGFGLVKRSKEEALQKRQDLGRLRDQEYAEMDSTREEMEYSNHLIDQLRLRAQHSRLQTTLMQIDMLSNLKIPGTGNCCKSCGNCCKGCRNCW